MKYLWVGCLIYSPLVVEGQEKLSQDGRFKVDFGKGCNPLSIKVTNLSNEFTGDPQYAFFIGGPQTLQTTHTYNQAGVFTIVQFGPRTTNELRDTLTLEVFDPVPPEFSVLSCVGNSASVEITDTFYNRFRIFFTAKDSFEVAKNDPVPIFTFSGSGTFPIRVKGILNNARDNCGEQTKTYTSISNISPATILSLEVTEADPIAGSILLRYQSDPDVSYALEITPPNRTSNYSTVTILTNPDSAVVGGLNTSEFFYCFRISAFDACQGSSLASDTVCSAAIDILTSQDDNQVNWVTSTPNFTSFELSKNGSSLSTFNDPNTTGYTDSEVSCKQENCYSLLTTYSNGITSITDTVCAITPFSSNKPPRIDHVSASVMDPNILLDWQLPVGVPANKFELSRQINVPDFSFLDTVGTNSFVDSGLSIGESKICYSISYEDECGNVSDPSLTSCYIRLKRASENRVTLQLSWDSYGGWGAGVNRFVVEKLDDQGNSIQEFDQGSIRTYEEPILQDQPQQLFFRVRAESNDIPASIIFSNLLEVNLPSEVLLPNAFAPEGLNNILDIHTFFVIEYEMRIYNRWGELIHVSNQGETGWDGRYKANGAKVPMGTYIYSIDFNDPQDRSFNQSGSIFLIRK
ncbi:MAG: gliding motility-associated C-terminal domain-containing protein [Bacteroidetes bacterium]|nr:gliding motility-associated C-terminal domain-containing protein [Bacteroidota bacterium]